jgi:nicotinamidase-related amidase
MEDGWGRMKDHTLWPDHCVIDTPGCQIDQDLQTAFEPWTSKMKLARKVCNFVSCQFHSDDRDGTRQSRIIQLSKVI